MKYIRRDSVNYYIQKINNPWLSSTQSKIIINLILLKKDNDYLSKAIKNNGL